MAEKGERWLLWLKISSPLAFLRKCKNFNICLHTVPAEMLYLQTYFTNFHKLFFSRKKTKVSIVVEISSAQTFWFSNSHDTSFPTCRKCKNFNFCLHTVPAEMLYLQRYLTKFLKRFLGWKRMRVAIVVQNFKCTDILVLQ